MTYYGYKRGDNKEIVDFSSVTTELPEKLRELEEIRATDRAEIEKQILTAEEKIADVPMGNDMSANNFALNSASMLADGLRTNTTLLRNGMMKPSQFAAFKQNSVDGMKTLKKVVDNFNPFFDEAARRQTAKESGVLEVAAVEQFQEMANFSNMVAFQDPKTGNMLVAPKDPKTGKPITKDAISLANMQNIMLQKYNRLDVDGEMSAIADQYGERIRVIAKGKVLTRKSIEDDPFMKGAIDSAMKAYNPQQLSSVLLDYMQANPGGVEYKVTHNRADADANDSLIYVKVDAANGNRLEPELSPEQTRIAKEALKEQLYARLDVVETARPEKTPRQPSSADETRAGEIEKATEHIDHMKDYWVAATGGDRSRAAAAIKGLLGDKFISLTPSADGKNATLEYTMKVSDDDGKTKTKKPNVNISLEGTFDQFVTSYSAILTGSDVSKKYYDEIQTDPAVSALTAGQTLGEGGYEVKFDPAVVEPEEIAPWEDVEEGITMQTGGIFSSAYSFGTKKDRAPDAVEAVEAFTVASKVQGVTTSVNADETVLTISFGGEDVTVNLDQNATGLQKDLRRKLKTVHTKAAKAALMSTNQYGV